MLPTPPPAQPPLAPATTTATAPATAPSLGTTLLPVATATLNDLGASFSGLFGNLAAAMPADRVVSEQEMQQGALERRNLLHVFKLTIKNLLESSVDLGEPVTDESTELNEFCLVIENVFKQGLRQRRSMFARDRIYWDFIAEGLERHPTSINIITTVRSLTGIRTPQGRGRAFIRSALMEQRLADYWNILLENRDLVTAYYEPYALLRSDDIVPISGMLVGLSTLEFNLFLKGDDLERLPETIDWAKYLRNSLSAATSPPPVTVSAVTLAAAAPPSPRLATTTSDSPVAPALPLSAVATVATTESMVGASVGAVSERSDSRSSSVSVTVSSSQPVPVAGSSSATIEQLQCKLNVAVDQKTYVEELKRKTEAKLSETIERLEQSLATQRSLEDQLGMRTERLMALERTVQTLQTELQQTRQIHKRDVDELQSNLENERAVFRASKVDTSQLNEGMRNTLSAETKLRESVERELVQERQRRMADRDMATNQITTLEGELQQMRDERETYVTTIASHLEQMTALSRERDERQAEIDQINKTLNETQEELKETKVKLAVMIKNKKEAKALKGDLDALQQRTTELQKLLDESRQETIRIINERTEKDRQLLGAVDRLDEANRLVDLERVRADKEKARCDELTAELEGLRQQNEEMREQLQERDHAFFEMSKKLETSQIKLSDLTDQFKGEWVDDKSVTHCLQCNDKFSVNRRKHHCRSCGGIFCQTCSNNKMTLPAFPKPVRVCDGCNLRLLQNHSS